MELGWSQKERVVFFNTGKRSAVKRQDLALDALDVAKRLCGDINLVFLNGFVDPKLTLIYMNAVDCLLLTSDYKDFPT